MESKCRNYVLSLMELINGFNFNSVPGSIPFKTIMLFVYLQCYKTDSKKFMNLVDMKINHIPNENNNSPIGMILTDSILEIMILEIQFKRSKYDIPEDFKRIEFSPETIDFIYRLCLLQNKPWEFTSLRRLMLSEVEGEKLLKELDLEKMSSKLADESMKYFIRNNLY